MFLKRIDYRLFIEKREIEVIPRFWGVYRHDPVLACVCIAPIPMNAIIAAVLKISFALKFPLWFVTKCSTLKAIYERGYKEGYARIHAEKYQQGYLDGYNHAFDFIQKSIGKRNEEVT